MNQCTYFFSHQKFTWFFYTHFLIQLYYYHHHYYCILDKQVKKNLTLLHFNTNRNKFILFLENVSCLYACCCLQSNNIKFIYAQHLLYNIFLVEPEVFYVIPICISYCVTGKDIFYFFLFILLFYWIELHTFFCAVFFWSHMDKTMLLILLCYT